MDTITISKEILETAKRLQKASSKIFELGKDKAETERNYRVALMHEMLILKSEGMSIGMINDVARGRVSELLFKRDLAEIMYKSGQESMHALQSTLSALQSLLKVYQEI